MWVCKKVKFSRYRPGVAQRVGRGIPLLFHDRGTRRGGGSGQQHTPAALYPQERPGTPFTGGWMGPRAGLDGRKISSPPGFLLITTLLILQYTNTMVAWRYLSNVLLTDYCPCVRIALFVCYSRPLGEHRYGGDVIGRRSPCRYGTVTQLSCS